MEELKLQEPSKKLQDKQHMSEVQYAQTSHTGEEIK